MPFAFCHIRHPPQFKFPAATPTTQIQILIGAAKTLQCRLLSAGWFIIAVNTSSMILEYQWYHIAHVWHIWQNIMIMAIIIFQRSNSNLICDAWHTVNWKIGGQGEFPQCDLVGIPLRLIFWQTLTNWGIQSIKPRLKQLGVNLFYNQCSLHLQLLYLLTIFLLRLSGILSWQLLKHKLPIS